MNDEELLSEEELDSPQWLKVFGFARSASLLLGYSVEMFLKSGLVWNHYGCTPDTLDKNNKKFSHDYIKLAKGIGFPKKGNDDKNFALLRRFVTDIARYPYMKSNYEDFKGISNNADKLKKMPNYEELKKISNYFYGEEKFSELCNLAERCEAYAVHLINSNVYQKKAGKVRPQPRSTR